MFSVAHAFLDVKCDVGFTTEGAEIADSLASFSFCLTGFRA